MPVIDFPLTSAPWLIAQTPARALICCVLKNWGTATAQPPSKHYCGAICRRFAGDGVRALAVRAAGSSIGGARSDRAVVGRCATVSRRAV
jgi:hypothetical protein